MTKFEEELFNKVPCKFELTTEAEYKKTTLINHFKNWHSDEEFQAEIKKLTDQLITRNDELISSNYEIESLKSQLISREKQVIELKEADKAQGKEIIQLKSQLQQQALPVVPEFVAEWYENKKNKLELAVYKINTLIDKKSFNDLTKIEKWFEGVENKPIETIFKMKDGYTVEKPQLFKLIFPNSTAVLQKDGKLNSFVARVYKKYLIENAMTEQEIKSIDERYWQFAVPVEDGE